MIYAIPLQVQSELAYWKLVDRLRAPKWRKLVYRLAGMFR